MRERIQRAYDARVLNKSNHLSRHTPFVASNRSFRTIHAIRTRLSYIVSNLCHLYPASGGTEKYAKNYTNARNRKERNFLYDFTLCFLILFRFV